MEYTTKTGQTVNASSQDIRHSSWNLTDKEGTSYINITESSHPGRVLYRITLIIIPTPSEGYGFDERKDATHISLPGPFTQIIDLTRDGRAQETNSAKDENPRPGPESNTRTKNKKHLGKFISDILPYHTPEKTQENTHQRTSHRPYLTQVKLSSKSRITRYLIYFYTARDFAENLKQCKGEGNEHFRMAYGDGLGRHHYTKKKKKNVCEDNLDRHHHQKNALSHKPDIMPTGVTFLYIHVYRILLWFYRNSLTQKRGEMTSQIYPWEAVRNA